MAENTTEGNLILDVRGLKVVFPTSEGLIRAVEGVDIQVASGECVCIVGESGCGKSVSALAMMRLLNSPPAVTSSRGILFDGIDLETFTEKEMQNVYGKRMSIIFQDALSALNPVMPVGKQIDEV